MKPIAIIFILITSNILTAQVTQEWVATYNGIGTGYNSPTKNAIDKFGNLIVCGKTDIGSTDYLILKYNSSGSLLWSRTYDGTAHSSDYLKDMILDDSGNIYVTGNSNEGAANGYFNWLTIKYSPNGEMRWKKNFDWTLHGEDVAYSITLDKKGNVFVGGYGLAPGGLQNFDIVLAKYNNDGIEQWVRTYDSNPIGHADWGYSVVADDSDCSYISGYSYSSKAITIKYDENGNQIWLREYPRMNAEYTIPLYSKIDKGNNIIVNGYYQVAGQLNFVTLKYDRNGNLLWDRVFDSPVGTMDYTHSIYTDDSLNVYVAGSTQGLATSHDALIIKYSPRGDTLWIRTYDDGIGEADKANSLIVDEFHNVYITGSTYTSENDDYLTLKYNINGELIWIKKFSLIHTNVSKTISLDRSQNIFISGFSLISSGVQAITSIKYSQLTGIEIFNKVFANGFTMSNFPNPFNPMTVIAYNLLTEGNVILKILDVNGKEVRVLMNGNQDAGKHSFVFEGNNLSSGIYFCTLTVNRIRVNIIKMLLIK